MKKFILKITTFFSIILIVVIISILLPPTPRAKKTMLFAKSKKDSLLLNVPKPRIIFIGGSNICFGLNSQTIHDSLKLNPINTGIHGNIGLIYMMDNVLKFISSGDIVVISAEYQQFYGDAAYGSEELLRVVMDNSPLQNTDLRWSEWANIYDYFPKYCFSKFNPFEYFNANEDLVYGVNSFNQFGDVYTHWGLKKENYDAYGSLGENYNKTIIAEIMVFKKKIEAKKAKTLLVFPGYQNTSFKNSKSQIDKVYDDFKKNNFEVISNPERYIIPDSLTFNTPYHLSKAGVDYRTNLIIQDLKKALKN